MARSFIRHKVFGTLYAVEFSEDGAALAACEVTEACACKHRLHTYDLVLDPADEIMKQLGDYEQFMPVCTDAVHLLTDITEASKECDVAEREFESARTKAKLLKETLDTKQQALRKLVREGGNAKSLPLFDKTA